MSMKTSKLSSIEQFVIDISIQKRHDANLTQLDLAEKLNVSPGFVGMVESKKFNTKYNLNHINKLAKIYNCSPKDFFPDRTLN
jgi:transcriptional regulator with XRE-family HTH domain